MFCPNCETLLKPKHTKNKLVFVCPNCKYTTKDLEDVEVVETIEEKKEIEVIEDIERGASVVVQAECPKCGNQEAYHWTVQTRASDEPETRFYRCTKCNYTWREYS